MDINTKTPADVTKDFDDIRPYRDDEIPSAVKRIASDPAFTSVMRYLFSGKELAEHIAEFPEYKTVAEFQIKFMQDALNSVILQTTDGFECSGFENLEKGRPYLFVSNHRDILLDAALLQLALYHYNLDCSEITFGDNLMQPGIVTDFGKANRMFKVVRSGNTTDFYNTSLHLSKYIRYCITERKQSVWIAQSNGRNKNGVDKTNPTVLKMFSLSGGRDFSKNFSELNIAPMAISYQWETCDAEKARELYVSKSQKYIKEDDEDMRSVLKGIMSPKGRVHIHIGKPLDKEDVAALAGLDRNSSIQKIADIIDDRIHKGYNLFDTNYIAYDMLYGSEKYSDHYDVARKTAFTQRMERVLGEICTESQLADGELRKIFLGIYANAVVSRENA